MCYINCIPTYGLVPYRNLGEEIDELQQFQNLQEIVLSAPRINFSVMNKMCLENLKNYKKFMIEKYAEWWKQVKINKDRYCEIEKLNFKYCSIFEENDAVLSEISDAFDSVFLEDGFLKGELYIISAPSGIGKTAFSIMLATVLASGYNRFKNSIFEPRKVVYVSLEQSEKQIQARIKSTLLGINDLKNASAYLDVYLNKGNRELLELAETLYQISMSHIDILSIDDFDSLSVEEILDVIKKRTNNLDVLVIDQYENIENSLNTVSDDVARTLKSFANKENIVLILQSQINKSSVEKAKIKSGLYDAQKLSGNSLRGTSGLEHQSTGILFIVPLDQERIIYGYKAKLVEIFISKNRYGESGKSLKMWHIGALNIFVDKDFDEVMEIPNVDL